MSLAAETSRWTSLRSVTGNPWCMYVRKDGKPLCSLRDISHYDSMKWSRPRLK